jgi:hypothetical protein
MAIEGNLVVQPRGPTMKDTCRAGVCHRSAGREKTRPSPCLPGCSSAPDRVEVDS